MTEAGNFRQLRVVCFGEVLLRLAAPAPQLLLQEPLLEPTFCGAEANVAVALAGLGHQCTLVTVLPANPLGQAARRAVAMFGVKVEVREVAARMGLYFLQPGAMARPASIVYDRAGSAFANAEPDGYDWRNLLGGADWLFVSGISAALGDRPLASLRDAMATARASGVRIAFDTNYRPALWQGREEVAARTIRELSCHADVLFAGRRAAAMMTGGCFDHADPDQGFQAAAKAMFGVAPQLQIMAATRRHIDATGRQDITGLIADRTSCAVSETIRLEGIVDRVGTGDAFAAGVLHGIEHFPDLDRAAGFAMACSQWAHSVPGDFLRASLDDITGIASGARDVRR